MDRAIHAAAAEQRAVRGVHDGVDVERRDVGDEDVEPRAAGLGDEESAAETCERRRPCGQYITPARPSPPREIDRAAHADIVEVLVEERRAAAPAGAVQHLEEIEVGVEPAAGVSFLNVEAEIDAVHVDAAVFARPVPCFSAPSSISRLTNSIARNSATSEELKVISLMRFMISRRRCAASSPAATGLICTTSTSSVWVVRKNGKIGGLAGVAAVPVGHAVDLDRAEHVAAGGRGHHRVGGDLLAREHAQPPGVHVGRRDEQRQVAAFAHRLEIDEALDQVAQRIDVERVEIVGRQESATIASNQACTGEPPSG